MSNAEKQEREASRVFSSLTLQTYQKHIQEAFKCFEWLSMTFLASFPKTEMLVMENYWPTVLLFRRPVIDHCLLDIPLKALKGRAIWTLVLSHRYRRYIHFPNVPHPISHLFADRK